MEGFNKPKDKKKKNTQHTVFFKMFSCTRLTLDFRSGHSYSNALLLLFETI